MSNLVRSYEARRVANALAGDGGYPAAVRMLVEYAEYLDRQEARCAPLVEALKRIAADPGPLGIVARDALRAYREG